MHLPLDSAPSTSSQEDVAAKRRFIEDFFENLEKSAELTDRLFSERHEDEARLLCCCYIEALGNGLDPSNGSGARSFARVLMDHGGELVLSLIHLRALQDSLPYKSTAPGNKTALEAASDDLDSIFRIDYNGIVFGEGGYSFQ